MLDENESVILVNTSDDEIGTAPKLAAHHAGQLHRAFSVFIRDPEGKLLIHRRADDKYHSGGLWTNSCCGHPRPGEDTALAARRRLREEMGIECDLVRAGTFLYRAGLDNGLIEHELDHVFNGVYSDDPHPDSAEVCEWMWISPEDLTDWVARDRNAFTAWFTDALDAATLEESLENPG